MTAVAAAAIHHTSSHALLIARRAARHRDRGRADHRAQGPPVPRADPRLGGAGGGGRRERRPTSSPASPPASGATIGSVGLLIALGAMIGGLLTASGGADRVVTAIVDRVGPRGLPWAMGGVAALIGIPLFFEIGVVLLIPIVLLVARRAAQPVLRVGIPALAGLSVLHGFIPPHPGPLVAIANLTPTWAWCCCSG